MLDCVERAAEVKKDRVGGFIAFFVGEVALYTVDNIGEAVLDATSR